MSATECRDCWLAEASTSEKIIRGIADWLSRPSPWTQLTWSMSALLGMREPTWYERHRELYEQTGDEAELRRMLRHVPQA